MRNDTETSNQENFLTINLLVGLACVIALGSFRKRYIFKIGIVDILVLIKAVHLISLDILRFNEMIFMDDTVIEIFAVLAYFYVRYQRFAEKELNHAMVCIISIGLLVALKAVIQVIGVDEYYLERLNVKGNFSNANVFSAYLVALIPIAIYMLKWKDKISLWLSALCIGYILICTFLISFLFSRIAIFTLLILIVISYSQHFKEGFIKRWAVISGLVVFMIFLCMAKSESSRGRVLIWKVSSGIIKENFWLGVGSGGFEANYNNYQARYFRINHNLKEIKLADETYYAFNDFLQLQAESGIVGSIIVISIIAYILVNLYKSRKLKNINNSFVPFCLVIFSVLIMGLVGYPFQEYSIKLLCYVVLAILVNTVYPIYGQHNNKIFRLGFYCIISATIVFYCSYKYNKIEQWIKISTGSNADSLEKYNLLYPSLKTNSYFLLDYSQKLTLADQDTLSIKMLKEAAKMLSCLSIEMSLGDYYYQISDYKKAENNYVTACNMVPNRFRTKYTLYQFYKNIGQINKSKKIGMEILKMPEKIPSVEVDLIKEEIQNTLGIKNIL